MRRIAWVLGALALLLLVGAADPDDVPRNIRLRAQTVGDSISFDLRWVAPQRGPRQTPITGYEWEFWLSTSPGDPLQTLAANGANPEADKQVLQLLPFSCSTPSTYYTARVKATGSFSAPAPWGASGTVEILCDDSPPGAPVVSLDTIAAEDPSTPADSTVLRPVALAPPVTYDPEADRLHFDALNVRASMCALAYRDGVPSVPLRGAWTLEPVNPSAPVTTAPDASNYDLACWDIWSVRNDPGASWYLEMCNQTDCQPVLVAGLAFPKLPWWARWPLLVVAIGLIGWSFLPGQRKSDP